MGGDYSGGNPSMTSNWNHFLQALKMYKQRDVGMTEKQSVNEGKLLHFTNAPPRDLIIYVHGHLVDSLKWFSHHLFFFFIFLAFLGLWS